EDAHLRTGNLCVFLMQEPDRWPRALLGPRRQRPGSRRAAEQRDELAPPHSITSSARASNGSGTVMPSALAVLRFRNIWTFVDCCTGSSPGFSPLRIRAA